MKLARRPRAVIFDLDGVLLDTEPLYTQATQEIVAEHGAVFDWSVKGDMIGRSALDGAEYLVDRLGIRASLSPEEYLRRRKPRLDALFPTAREITGARAFVEELLASGVPLGLATSSERYQFELKTSRHGWFDGFRAVVCGDDPRIGALKPAPDIFLVTAAELRESPEDCLVFEDSLAGVESARRAGMQVVALPDPAMDASRYTEAHVVVRSYGEIVPADLGLG